MPHRNCFPAARLLVLSLLTVALAAGQTGCGLEREPETPDAATPEPSWSTPDAASPTADAGVATVDAEIDIPIPGRTAGATSFDAPEGTGLDPVATIEPPIVPGIDPVNPDPAAAGRGTSPYPLDGQWIGGPAGTPETLIEVAGTLVSGRPLHGESPEGTLFEVVSAAGNHVRFRAAREGNVIDVHGLFLDADNILVWVGGEGEPQLLRRVRAMPEALLGEWQGIVAGDGQAPERVLIEADAVSSHVPPEGVIEPHPVTGFENMQQTPLYALAGAGDTVEAVAVPPTGARIVRFRMVDEGAVLSWSDQGQVAVLYRAGSAPTWGETLQPPSVEVEPTPVNEGTGQTAVDPATALGDMDAAANLRRLADLAVAYYAAPQLFPSSTSWAPASEDCPIGSLDPTAFAGPTWTALAFVPTGGSAYQYRFISEAPAAFEVQARIDRDCDGVYHKLSIAGFASGGVPRVEDLVEENPGE